MTWGEQYRVGPAQDRAAARAAVRVMSDMGFAAPEMRECLEALSLIPGAENADYRYLLANRDMPTEIGGPSCSPKGEPTRVWVD